MREAGKENFSREGRTPKKGVSRRGFLRTAGVFMAGALTGTLWPHTEESTLTVQSKTSVPTALPTATSEPTKPAVLPEATKPSERPTQVSEATRVPTKPIEAVPTKAVPEPTKMPEVKRVEPSGNMHVGLGNGVYLETGVDFVSRVHVALDLILDLKTNKIDFKKVEGYNFYGFEQRIKENLLGGIRTYVVLETNGEPRFDGISKEDFGRYAEIIAKKLNSPNTVFIIGNEEDLPNSPWRMGNRLDKAVDFYVAAANAIKKVNPDIKVATYGAAYWGGIEDGKFANFLKPYIQKIMAKKAPIDMVCWHFHDTNLGMMENRASLYKNLLKELGLKDTSLVLSEAGWPVVVKGDDEALANYAASMVAAMGLLVQKGTIEDGMFFAGVDQGNNTSTLSKWVTGRGHVGKPSLTAFLFARKMFFSKVELRQGDLWEKPGLYKDTQLAKITAVSLSGKPIEFLYNFTDKDIPYFFDNSKVTLVDVYGKEWGMREILIRPNCGYYLVPKK